jgi:hypothetical protein
MQRLIEKTKVLAEAEGTFDIVIDPKIGKMELQEIGIDEYLEFSGKEGFAYSQGAKGSSMQKFIFYIAGNLGITGEETEVEDRMTDKVVRLDVDFDPVGKQTYWVTFWYNSGVGSILRQGKMEMVIKAHSDKLPDRYAYYETRKKSWVLKIALGCKEEYPEGLPMDDFNDYVKRNNLLWVLEEVLAMGYDIWDFLSDINREMGVT